MVSNKNRTKDQLIKEIEFLQLKVIDLNKREVSSVQDIQEAYLKLERSQEALLNLMEDLSLEIMERKQAQEKLTEEHDLLRLLIDNIPDYIYVKDVEGGFVLNNLSHLSHLKSKNQKDAIGKNVFNYYDPPTAKKMHADDMNIINGNSLINTEDSIVDIDGTSRWFVTTKIPLSDNNNQVIGLIGISRDITARKKAEQALINSESKLRKLAQYLQKVREMERTKIAREMHDELGQLSTALKMDLIWVKNKFASGNTLLLEKISSMTELTDILNVSIKRIASELRPGIIDDLGLIPAIQWFVNDFQTRTGILCTLEIPDSNYTFEPEMTTAIYRILQESLTNVARHSHATSVEISINILERTLHMCIADNGIGISQKRRKATKSFGLIGIEERVAIFNGKVDIVGVSNEGTTVTVSLPLGP